MISLPDAIQTIRRKETSDMFAAQDLRMVQHMQAELRREAAQHRLAARVNKQEPRKAQPRRFGLRLSLA